MTNHDERERDRIHPVNMKVEDPNAYQYAPEVAGQEGDIEKCGRGESEQDGSQGIEERERECITDYIVSHRTRPCGITDGMPVEDGRLGPIDEHAPEAKLTDDLVQRPLRHQELLGQIRETIEGGAEQSEEIASNLVVGRSNVAARDTITGQQQSHSAYANQDA